LKLIKSNKKEFDTGLVSIIIPVFNREIFLPETLESILSQSYKFWECIIVDDGSIDSSLNVAKKFASIDDRFRVYSRPLYKKKGANACRNYGFHLSKGEFIQWFDSDDIMNENYLGIVIQLISSSKMGMVVVQANLIDLNTGNVKTRFLSKYLLESENPAFAYLFKDAWFQTSQVILKRSVVIFENNIFETDLPRNQEAEYFTRLLLKGNKIECYTDQSLVYLKVHNNSIGGQYVSDSDSSKMRKDYLAYFKMFKNFKNSKLFNTDTLYEFQQFFIRCLRIMDPYSKQYLHLFFFGVYLGLFNNKILAIKIFITRSMNFLKK
jgi:glycosyltransferase involved in cell wall biosynthesis